MKRGLIKGCMVLALLGSVTALCLGQACTSGEWSIARPGSSPSLPEGGVSQVLKHESAGLAVIVRQCVNTQWVRIKPATGSGEYIAPRYESVSAVEKAQENIQPGDIFTIVTEADGRITISLVFCFTVMNGCPMWQYWEQIEVRAGPVLPLISSIEEGAYVKLTNTCFSEDTGTSMENVRLYRRTEGGWEVIDSWSTPSDGD